MATTVAFSIYTQLDPAKKTVGWANNSINRLRMDWRPLTNLIRCRDNKAYLFGQQSMEKIKGSFKDKKFKNQTEFIPIDVMFNILNTLTEDIIKSPPKAELKATDPSAQSDRDKDIQMLKSRSVIEGDISKYNQQIGLPPYKLPKENFKGNIEDFDKMGLDETDPDDLSFYQQNFQRLIYEIAGQQVINNVMKLNRFDEDKIMKFVIDMLAVNAICMQTYVDKITGEIKLQYIYPETAYGIFNDWNDGFNDICKGWQDTKTVQEFLEKAGNDFDFKRDWTKLIWAVNFCTPTLKVTGFKRDNVVYNCCGNEMLATEAGLTGREQENVVDWTLAYQYKVWMGYIEWNTCEATSTMLYKKTEGDPTIDDFIDFVPYSYLDDKKGDVTEYQTKSNYQQQWYGSYFLATTSISQWLFGFGKVYYQQLEGANDEYSSGTLKYFLKEGQSAAEIAKPFIDFVNFAFYKILWLVWHAKPEEDQVVVEELIAISKGLQRMYPQDGTSKVTPSVENILTQMIKYQRENFVRLRAFPQIDGKTIPQLPQLEGKRNGIDPISAQMLQFMQWAEMKIAGLWGINPMRLGGNPPSRESFKSEQSTLQSSYNSTGYIYRDISYLKKRIATSVLMYSQDIIKFKDSIPYKWLNTIVGNEMFASLDVLNNFAAHRMGIFVDDYNSTVDKQRILQAADFALQNKMIGYDGWFMVTQTEDFKLANKMLSYLQLKKEKKLRKQAVNDMKMQDQMAENAFKRQIQLLQEEGKVAIQKSQLAKQATEDAATINTDGKIKVKQMTIDAEPEKAAAKTESGKELTQAKADAEQQKAFPAIAG